MSLEIVDPKGSDAPVDAGMETEVGGGAGAGEVAGGRREEEGGRRRKKRRMG